MSQNYLECKNFAKIRKNLKIREILKIVKISPKNKIFKSLGGDVFFANTGMGQISTPKSNLPPAGINSDLPVFAKKKSSPEICRQGVF